MNAETIKDFLVSLGFDVDSKGAKKFDSTIKSSSAQIIKMGTAVVATSAAIFAFTSKIASGLDKVYFAGQKTGATAASIKALSYAAEQMGIDVNTANAALNGISRFMRENPGGESYLNRLGIQTRQANGQLKDTAEILLGLGDKLKKMPYYMAKQYADMLGVSEDMLLSLRSGMSRFSAEHKQMSDILGINYDDAAKKSNEFMTEWRGTWGIVQVLMDKIGSDLAGEFTHDLTRFKNWLIINGKSIENVLSRVVRFFLFLTDAISRLAYRAGQAIEDLGKWWDSLEVGTRKLIASFGGLIAAWWALNTAFMTSPLGLIILLAAAIALLYDDYKTWKEGGKSLIDWEKWEPGINSAIRGIKKLWEWVEKGKNAVGGWENVFVALALYITGTWLGKMLGAIGKVSTAATSAGGLLGKLGFYAAAIALLYDPAEKALTGIVGEENKKILDEHGLFWSSDFSFFFSKLERDRYQATLDQKNNQAGGGSAAPDEMLEELKRGGVKFKEILGLNDQAIINLQSPNMPFILSNSTYSQMSAPYRSELKKTDVGGISTNIYISGVYNPDEAAKKVVTAQSDVYRNLTRELSTKVN